MAVLAWIKQTVFLTFISRCVSFNTMKYDRNYIVWLGWGTLMIGCWTLHFLLIQDFGGFLHLKVIFMCLVCLSVGSGICTLTSNKPFTKQIQTILNLHFWGNFDILISSCKFNLSTQHLISYVYNMHGGWAALGLAHGLRAAAMCLAPLTGSHAAHDGSGGLPQNKACPGQTRRSKQMAHFIIPLQLPVNMGSGSLVSTQLNSPHK